MSLSGTSPVSSDFHPPIELESNIRYVIGLISFECYGLDDGPFLSIIDKHLYVKSKTADTKKMSIPSGLYNTKDLESTLNNLLLVNGFKPLSISFLHKKEKFQFKTPSDYGLIFTNRDSLHDLIGMTIDKGEIMHSETFTSSIEPKLPNIKIAIESNIASGSYQNELPCHIIYESSISANHQGYINLEPTNIIYLPVNTQRIKTLTAELKVNKNYNLKFKHNSYFKVRFHIKEWDSISIKTKGEGIKHLHSH